MDMGLQGKVVVVSGATGGIGKAIAAAFVAEGAKVAVLGRKREEVDKAAQEIGRGPGSATASSPICCRRKRSLNSSAKSKKNSASRKCW